MKMPNNRLNTELLNAESEPDFIIPLTATLAHKEVSLGPHQTREMFIPAYMT